jgi:hypothetical protein
MQRTVNPSPQELKRETEPSLACGSSNVALIWRPTLKECNDGNPNRHGPQR